MQEIPSHTLLSGSSHVSFEFLKSLQRLKTRCGSYAPRRVANRPHSVASVPELGTSLAARAKNATVSPSPVAEKLHQTAEMTLRRLMERQATAPCFYATVWSYNVTSGIPRMIQAPLCASRVAPKDDFFSVSLPTAVLKHLRHYYRQGITPAPIPYCNEDWKTICVIPTSIRDGHGGFICLYHQDVAKYTQSDLELMQIIADSVMDSLRAVDHCDYIQHQARLDEQRRIARDLHDTMVQDATGAVLQLENAMLSLSAVTSDVAPSGTETVEAHRHILLASGLTRRLMERLRKTMWCLHSHPGGVEEEKKEVTESFTQKAMWLTRQILSPFEKEIDVYLSVSGEEIPMTRSIAAELSHLLTEGLNNVVKHAHASRVDVAIDFNESGVRLAIRDNGCGFETKPRRTKELRGRVPSGHGGFGCMGMRERVKALRGRISVSSSVGNGTKILIAVPL